MFVIDAGKVKEVSAQEHWFQLFAENPFLIWLPHFYNKKKVRIKLGLNFI
jgi:hypothetical protein